MSSMLTPIRRSLVPARYDMVSLAGLESCAGSFDGAMKAASRRAWMTRPDCASAVCHTRVWTSQPSLPVRSTGAAVCTQVVWPGTSAAVPAWLASEVGPLSKWSVARPQALTDPAVPPRVQRPNGSLSKPSLQTVLVAGTVDSVMVPGAARSTALGLQLEKLASSSLRPVAATQTMLSAGYAQG